MGVARAPLGLDNAGEDSLGVSVLGISVDRRGTGSHPPSTPVPPYRVSYQRTATEDSHCSCDCVRPRLACTFFQPQASVSARSNLRFTTSSPSNNSPHSSSIDLFSSDSDSSTLIPHLYLVGNPPSPFRRRRTTRANWSNLHPSLATSGVGIGHVPRMAAPKQPETSR